jgi:hypothetical protein
MVQVIIPTHILSASFFMLSKQSKPSQEMQLKVAVAKIRDLERKCIEKLGDHQSLSKRLNEMLQIAKQHGAGQGSGK